MPTSDVEVRESGRAPLTTEGLPPAQRFKREGIAGLLFVLSGLAVLYLVPAVSLSCERTAPGAPLCELEWTVFFDQIPVRRTEVPGLSGAGVEVLISERSKNRTHNYQAILHTDRGPVRLNLSGLREPIETAVAEIQSYLESGTDRRLRVEIASPMPVLSRIATGVVIFGLLYFVYLPLYLFDMLRGTRSPEQTVTPG